MESQILDFSGTVERLTREADKDQKRRQTLANENSLLEKTCEKMKESVSKLGLGDEPETVVKEVESMKKEVDSMRKELKTLKKSSQESKKTLAQ